MEGFVHEEEEVDHPMRYLPIRHVYSSTAPCTSPGAMSKKVEARKLIAADRDADEEEKKLLDRDTDNAAEPRLLVYRRRNKRARPPTSFDLVAHRVEGGASEDNEEAEEEGDERGDTKMKKRRLPLKNELLRLGTGSSISGRARSRGLRASGRSLNFSEVRKRRCIAPSDLSGLSKVKKWVELDVEGADPDALVGLACKVYWPMDADWYRGTVTEHDSATKQHCVNYDDGEVERLILVDEKVKFHISSEEMQHLNLKFGVSNKEKDALNYNEMLALAVSFDDCQELEPGDIVWAKLTGHAMWPAVIVDESNIGSSRSLKPVRRDQSVLVQFFGTHDFARISFKQATPFLNGLLSSLHLKCKKTRFFRSLDEAKVYLSNRQLPKSMLHLQKVLSLDDVEGSFGEDLESSEDLSGNEKMKMAVEPVRFSPLEIGDLRVTNLGKIVCDSEYFHSKLYIWPEGYTAFRMFISVKDSSVKSCYKMEVLRDEKSKLRPLFRVTTVDGEQIDGSNPTACWKEIYRRILQNQCNKLHMDAEGCKFQKSGSYMFGFTTPQISQLIQDLPNSRFCSKYFENNRDLPAGYRAVRVKWKDLDRCSVCHMDEEYENNLFLQCDKCRMMVHAKCYGEIEPLDGVLWLCNVCRPGAPKFSPPCCLCPVIGGAIKPTTDGRWAHLTCAMWIPETCLLDVKKMEPIDGINRISKDRWKLLCSICGVSYGACIQCSNSTCRVAYHPLCARAAGLCVELEDEDKLHLMSLDEDDDQCVRLLSFCKKHRQPSNELPTTDDTCILPSQQCSTYVPASNPSGCARTEPYNFFGRRGQKEPQVLAAASVKRLFLENRPHLVTGYRQNGNGYGSCCNGYSQTGNPSNVTRASLHNTSANVISMAEKYKIMKATFRKRLAFGKSKIHGFGVFAKLAHKAGDMVIEYTGELVRPSIADMREHLFYNSLVGAGTYMFRIDDERVIDATRAGSIAHLINHSCEPNCYSRVISVHGDEHIIIFAKRDISQSEELTYDYRFFSIDEQLACYCGFARCRNVVNDIEAEEHVSRIRVPQSELIPWRGE